jgi:hypothetical protein
MSAYIVDRDHIAYLVHSADIMSRSNFTWWNGTDHETMFIPTATGQILWDSNIESVQHRYRASSVEQLPGPTGETYVYTHQLGGKPVNPLAVLKAIQSYQYQSCEHPGWATCNAKRFTDALRMLAIRNLPGYGDASWEIHYV